MNKWGIKPSSWYYIWGMIVALSMHVCITLGVSVWIFAIPVAVIGAIGIALIEKWLEPNRHMDDL